MYSETTMDEMVSGTSGLEWVYNVFLPCWLRNCSTVSRNWTLKALPTRRWRTRRSSTPRGARSSWCLMRRWFAMERNEQSMTNISDILIPRGIGCWKKTFHYWCNCLNYCNFTILAIIVILPILVIIAIIVIIAFQMNGDFAVDTGEVKEARWPPHGEWIEVPATF